jgi:Tfp pilus assembly protein PilO
MSYALRNTIVLAAFLAIIFSVGFYLTKVVQPGEKKKLQTEIVTLNRTIAQRPSVEADLKSSQDKLSEMKNKYNKRFKVIPDNDTTALTYAYLNRIMNSSGFVKFDMLYEGPKAMKQYGYNTYNLKGETSYTSLFKFIWYMEHARLLYKIGDLSLTGHEVRDEQTGMTETIIPFTMELRAYYSSVAGVSSEMSGVDPTFYRPVDVGLNFLRPLISTEPPPNVRGLVDVERSDLKAVMSDKVFIVDQNGMGHILRIGDEVYLGYLTKIDQNKNQAEFTLNKGGIIDRVDLKVRFGK